jgi:hypothetical protein
VRRAALIAGGVALIALVVVLATSVFGGGGSNKPSGNRIVTSPAAANPGAPGTATGGSVTPSAVTVSVLNGTSVPGLARTVANDLQRDGYVIGAVTNAPIQQHPTTTVAFAAGGRAAAQAVARAIGVSPSTIAAEDLGTRGVAGPQALVVVTVGADRQH